MHAEQTVTDETFDVSAGTYRQMSFRLRKEAQVSVRLAVRDGSAVDLYLMDSQQGRERQCYHSASDARVTGVR